ncbi:MAG TPA: glycosyltransferase [Amnibacterium sp.]|nr:glycosyltransferase [Amnibacterium sp.]
MNGISLVVSLGTDHHRFDRLVEWTENWVAAAPFHTDLFVQYGSTRAPRIGAGAQLLPRAEMLERYRNADIVVTQGGPGSILDVASVGKMPIVVPRHPDFNEHIDGHQVVFGRFMADRSEAVLVEDEVTFDDVLDRAAVDPASLRRDPRRSPASGTAAALAAVVDDVMQRPAGFVRWPRFRQVGGIRPDSARLARQSAGTAEPVFVASARSGAEPVPVQMVIGAGHPGRRRIA